MLRDPVPVRTVRGRARAAVRRRRGGGRRGPARRCGWPPPLRDGSLPPLAERPGRIGHRRCRGGSRTPGTADSSPTGGRVGGVVTSSRSRRGRPRAAARIVRSSCGSRSGHELLRDEACTIRDWPRHVGVQSWPASSVLASGGSLCRHQSRRDGVAPSHRSDQPPSCATLTPPGGAGASTPARPDRRSRRRRPIGQRDRLGGAHRRVTPGSRAASCSSSPATDRRRPPRGPRGTAVRPVPAPRSRTCRGPPTTASATAGGRRPQRRYCAAAEPNDFARSCQASDGLTRSGAGGGGRLLGGGLLRGRLLRRRLLRRGLLRGGLLGGLLLVAGPRSRRSASSSAARSMVISSTASPLRRLALVSPSVTYGPKRPSRTTTGLPWRGRRRARAAGRPRGRPAAAGLRLGEQRQRLRPASP